MANTTADATGTAKKSAAVIADMLKFLMQMANLQQLCPLQLLVVMVLFLELRLVTIYLQLLEMVALIAKLMTIVFVIMLFLIPEGPHTLTVLAPVVMERLTPCLLGKSAMTVTEYQEMVAPPIAKSSTTTLPAQTMFALPSAETES